MITQELLQKVWRQGWFTTDNPVTKSGVQAKVLFKLAKEGSITVWDIQQAGTTGAGKMVTRLRREGWIKPTDSWEVAKNGTRYKRYWWTGKTLEGKK